MTEKLSPEGVLVRIAHTIKQEGLKPGTKDYKSLIKKQTWRYLEGQTIEQALRNGQREKVLHELTLYADNSFS